MFWISSEKRTGELIRPFGLTLTQQLFSFRQAAQKEYVPSQLSMPGRFG
jgi:hypothetical protein